MAMTEGAGVELHFETRGQGPPVLLVHGLAADAAGFEPLAAALAGTARTIAYDRRGYGSSGVPEPYTATTVCEQAEDAAALLSGLDVGPALAVGDGFGAVIVLDLIKRHPELIRGAVVSDPALFALVPAATEILSADRALLERSLRAGGPELAVEAWLDGRADGPALARARAAHRGFLADFGGLASWGVTRGELRGLGAPLVVLTGPASPPHVIAAADALAGLVPSAGRRHDGDLAGSVQELLE